MHGSNPTTTTSLSGFLCCDAGPQGSSESRYFQPTRDSEQDRTSSHDDENTRPMLLTDSTSKQATQRPTLRAQLTGKDTKIAELQAVNLRLSVEIHQLRIDHERLSSAHDILLDHKRSLSVTNRSLNSLKRKAQTAFDEELVLGKFGSGNRFEPEPD
ncbi:hypothetical protein B0H17DRAFT_1037845 [Mycena rosella]|uniref:Uncharacterized protein n=1 Tax=Mycena rosella TaxID=1033263 RepID=A0AAD7GU73_MYCRO|nr:hypothetical protein B0H17DRAFT_1037845 [Mycena rosella]